MIISSCKPTGSSCLIPPPNLEPIPAAMINNVVFILHLICFFFVLLYFGKASISHTIDFVGNNLLCILFYTEFFQFLYITFHTFIHKNICIIIKYLFLRKSLSMYKHTIFKLRCQNRCQRIRK